LSELRNILVLSADQLENVLGEPQKVFAYIISLFTSESTKRARETGLAHKIFKQSESFA
jgi:hypothetical protein